MVRQRTQIVLIYGMQEKTDNPLALLYFRSYCLKDPIIAEKATFSILTFDIAEETTAFIKKIVDINPAVFAASCYVWNTDITLEICDAIKKYCPETVVILGGPDVGSISNELLHSHPFVDIVVSGEGEETFRDVIRSILDEKPFSNISGLAYQADAIVFPGPRRQALDLDEIPVLFCEDNKDYLSLLNGKVLYETSRGCIHSCFFCNCGTASRGPIRFFPYDRIESEINFILRQNGVTHLYISDAELNARDSHAKQVLKIINASKSYQDWAGVVTFHLEFSKRIDPELRDLICEATSGIGVGVQSLNEEALKQMGRSWFNFDIFEENVKMLEKDIHIVHQFIYGCPGDNYNSFRDSLRWAVDNDRDVWFDRLQVLPGTIYRENPERYGIQYESRRPYYVTSCNTFSSFDIAQAEALKRGSILYTFRKIINLNKLCEVLTLDRMSLLEAFGKWCVENVPGDSMAYSRKSPNELTKTFIETLASWIGRFVRTVLVHKGINPNTSETLFAFSGNQPMSKGENILEV